MAASATCMANRVGWTRSIPVTVSRRRHRLGHREAGLARDQRLRLGDGRREHRFVRQQVSAHRGPLRTLPGEHPYRSAVVLTDRGLIRSVTVGDLPQRLDQLLGAAGDDGRPHGPVATPARQGVGQIRQRHLAGMCASTQSASRPAVRRSPSAEVDDSGNSSGAAIADPVACVLLCRECSGACSTMACTLVPEIPVRRHRRPSGVLAVGRPRCDLLRHKQFRVDPGKLIGQPGEVQILRNHAVLQREDGLDQAQCSGGGLSMPEIGLHRRRARTGRRCRRPWPGWCIRWGHPPGCPGRAPQPCRRCRRPRPRQPTPPDIPRSALSPTAWRCSRCGRPGWRPCRAPRPESGHRRAARPATA